MPSQTKICIIGLGYVGLPLAVAFARVGKKVLGFDKNQKRIKELQKNLDSTGEIAAPELKKAKIFYSADPAIIQKANFLIAAIPTPIDRAKRPDLKLLKLACQTIGQNLEKGSIVVFESTVYPGVTEDICVPIIEKYAQMKVGRDWFVGYSPERINPGDQAHGVDRVIKVVSGMNPDTLNKIARVYRSICRAGIHKAPNIKTAEAAKVIENIQRDLNIALINELSMIFHRLGLNTREVLKAAGTKWNFHAYQPGLVGGHCIGVDPYYLTYRAEEIGYHPEVILAGRRINDQMARYVGELLIQSLIGAGKRVQKAKVLILGLTFKENVRDTRNSKATDIIAFLNNYLVDLFAYDPMLSAEEIKRFGVQPVASLTKMPRMDGVIMTVIHDQFKTLTLAGLKKMMTARPVLLDVKSHFAEQNPESNGLIYQSL